MPNSDIVPNSNKKSHELTRTWTRSQERYGFRERERSRTKIDDYHFINNFNQLLRIAVDEGIAWGLTRKERRENKRWSGFIERENDLRLEREREAKMWLAMFGFSLIDQQRADLGKSVPGNEQRCQSDGPRCRPVCLCLRLPTDSPTFLILDSKTWSGWFFGLCSIRLRSEMQRLRLRSKRWGLGGEGE